MTEETTVPDITYNLAASPNYSEDGVCFAARGSGLYRSQDGGETWQDAYEALKLKAPLPTMAVVVSPDFGGDRTVFTGVPGGILRSFNAGDTWDVVELPSPPPTVSGLVISPNYARDGILLAATVEDGVFSTSNRGGQWTAWNFGLLDLNTICLAISPDFAQDETLFVGTDSGIFRSPNGGRAWREVDFSPDLAPVLSLAMSPAYAQDRTLFAGTESEGLFCTQDGGLTWVRLQAENIDGAVNAILLSPQFPDEPEILVAGSDRLLFSRDGGQQWSAWGTSGRFDDGLACVAAPEGHGAGASLLVGLLAGGVQRI
jgi:photosystem II stability/assembly factor-like uncharacterized protein